MIKAENIYKTYGNLTILKGISLEVKPQEILAIVGSSGAGKTSLLQILGTLDKSDEKPQSNIWIDGQNIQKLKANKLATFRNKNIGFIFQFYQLLPELTALDNIILPGLIAGENKKTLENKAKTFTDFLKVSHRINHRPNALSGGEQQRIAIARALINQPKIILADEPSGNLDSKNAQELHQLFFDLRQEFQQTFVIVTHNEQLAEMCDRKLQMHDGQFI